MTPICVPCKRFYRCKKNGYWFLEGMPIGENVKSGNAEPEKWEPYKLWVGDLYECLGCGHQTIAGVPSHHADEHYTATFKDNLERFEPQIQINDCG